MLSHAIPMLLLALDASPDTSRAVKFAELGSEIVVTALHERRSNESATKTDTPLQNIPQTISVIDSRQIADQGMRSIQDVLRYVPGVALSGGEGHRDQIVVRGNGSTADFFVDGLRDDVQYYRGLYNLDRVEVLKGPNAMIFGRGGGGGVVNRVTKRPERARIARGTVSLDERGAWYGEADLNSPFGERFSARANAVYEEFNNFRDAYEGYRIGLNPTLALTPNAATRIDVGFEYAADRRVVDRGLPSDGGRPLTGFDRTFFGDTELNRTRFTGKVGTARFEHRFTDRLKLVSKALYGDYDKFYRNVLAATPVTTVGGVRRVGLEAYQSPTTRRNLLLQTDLIADVTTGPVSHTLLVGTDFGDQRTHAERTQGFFDSGPFTSADQRRYMTPLASDIFVPTVTFRDGIGRTDARTRAKAFGVYVQDQAKIGDHLEIVAGLRRDQFELAVNDLRKNAFFRRTDLLWSPRIGLVLKPTDRLSLYASFSRSFLPQSGDQFSSLDVTTAALKPERFTNREAGVKWAALPGLDVSLAAYRLDRTDTRATDPATNLTVLTGAQRSRGVELTVQGEVSRRLTISGGAALQEAEITRTTVAAPTGRKVPLVPKFQASLWGRYNLTDRLGAGLGVYHQSNSFASISNTVVLPAFTRVDAAAFAKLGHGAEFQLNVENLIDRSYVGLAFNDNNLTPANPRTVRATLRFGI